MTESETKELILLAARAYGLDDAILQHNSYTIFSDKIKGPIRTFDPYADDGDSARLRTKLRMETYWLKSKWGDALKVTLEKYSEATTWSDFYKDATEDQLNAALRLATLKCAAEIGRRME